MTRTIALILRLIVAVILLQTLYFKFGGHPEAVHLFTTLGAEPWGRIGLGVIELIVAIGLLVPKKQILASFAALGIMAGAIGAHLLTPLVLLLNGMKIQTMDSFFLWPAFHLYSSLFTCFCIPDKCNTA
jgi:uncharacterized membrane protein YphA (DoxX/SURF4 family)